MYIISLIFVLSVCEITRCSATYIATIRKISMVSVKRQDHARQLKLSTNYSVANGANCHRKHLRLYDCVTNEDYNCVQLSTASMRDNVRAVLINSGRIRRSRSRMHDRQLWPLFRVFCIHACLFIVLLHQSKDHIEKTSIIKDYKLCEKEYNIIIFCQCRM